MNIPAPILEKLRAHQREPAQHLLDVLMQRAYALDGSDTGVGKTYVATGIAATLNLPTLCVVPKIAVTGWKRAAQHLGTSFSVTNPEMIRTGMTPFGWWDNNPPKGNTRETYLECQNCQCIYDPEDPKPCHCHHMGIHCLETKKRKWKYGHFNWHPAIKFAIVDEVHRFGATDSLNAEMLIGLKRQRIPALCLSATPAIDPLDFRALGFLLGLHDLVSPKDSDRVDFWSWARRYGCRPDQRFGGWKFFGSKQAQLDAMHRLHQELFPSRGVRIRTEDIPGFPERDITAELYDIKENHKIDSLYLEMGQAIEELRLCRAGDKAPEHPLTKILRARQEIELLKVPIVVELVADALAKGYSVAVFVNFDQTMTELMHRLKCRCVIHGKQSATERQKCIDDYVADKERVILVNNQAGGISCSLQDLRGEFPRMGFVMPSHRAVDMKQVFGRFHRDGAKSKCHYRVLFVAGTVEVPMHRSLAGKLNNLDALTDADLQPQNLAFAA